MTQAFTTKCECLVEIGAEIVDGLEPHRDPQQAVAWPDLRCDGPLPGVVEVSHVAGGTDYLLHVATTDTAALHDFILEYFTASQAIQQAETSLVFRYLRGTNLRPTD